MCDDRNIVNTICYGYVWLGRAKSSGAGFFVQLRFNRNKRLSHIYNFKTMVEGANRVQREFEHWYEVDGAAFKLYAKGVRFGVERTSLRREARHQLPATAANLV